MATCVLQFEMPIQLHLQHFGQSIFCTLQGPCEKKRLHNGGIIIPEQFIGRK